MKKLTRSEVEAVRGQLLARQGFRCLLCGGSLRGKSRGGAVLDHCHTHGYVRGVLCRTCNAGEGKVKGNAVRYGGGVENHVKWLRKLADYLEHHQTPRTVYIHPDHQTDDEKRLLKNKRARQARARARVKK